MRALLANYGFIVSVLVAMLVTAVFAFVFEAPLPLVAIMLVLGVLTALMEQFFQSSDRGQADDTVT
jgi:uncharacterized membrane protein YjjB (DUF3815 family)